MQLARNIADLTTHIRALRISHGRVALVPTMGALHEGHLALIAAARAGGAAVVASIFVNPLQFGPQEDLSRYPRDEEGDLAKLAEAGCDLVWLPSVEEMYPEGDATTISVAGPALGFEGAIRPGHFTGVATVVAKLFTQTRADAAYFGAKDWQQLQVIRRMVADLRLPIAIEAVPIQRASDGLALSSRNRFLTEAERMIAPMLYLTLSRLAAELRDGVPAEAAIGAAEMALRVRRFKPDYLALVDGVSLQPITSLGADSRLLVAAKLGSVRLLDNVEV